MSPQFQVSDEHTSVKGACLRSQAHRLDQRVVEVQVGRKTILMKWKMIKTVVMSESTNTSCDQHLFLGTIQGQRTSYLGYIIIYRALCQSQLFLTGTAISLHWQLMARSTVRNCGFRSYPGLFLGTTLTPRTSRRFEVERKCELVERLDLVHIHRGHRAEIANRCTLASWPNLNPSNALFYFPPIENRYSHGRTSLPVVPALCTHNLCKLIHPGQRPSTKLILSGK